MNVRLMIVLAIGCVASVLCPTRGTFAQTPTGTPAVVTLPEALARALAHNPDLAIAAQDIGIAEADVRQAHLWPNPEFEWEGEDISGSMPGFRSSEHTIVLSQTIELGGKRSARARQAESQVAVAEADLEAVRLDVTAELTARFIAALLAQRRSELRAAAVHLAEELQRAAGEKVAAGAAATVEAIRADVALANARIDSARATSEARKAHRQLAAMWGAAEPDFDSVSGDLPPCIMPPTMSRLLETETTTPRLRRWPASTQRARDDLTVARAAAMPDLTISAGPRFFAENGDRTFILGVSVPLPLFNRNQGAVIGSQRAVAQAESQYDAARRQWQSRLLITHEEMTAAYREAATIEQELIPQAQAACDEMQRGYSQGRFDYLDLLAAEHDLVAARERLLDARQDYHLRRIEIESLIGSDLEELEDSDVQ